MARDRGTWLGRIVAGIAEVAAPEATAERRRARRQRREAEIAARTEARRKEAPGPSVPLVLLGIGAGLAGLAAVASALDPPRTPHRRRSNPPRPKARPKPKARPRRRRRSNPATRTRTRNNPRSKASTAAIIRKDRSTQVQSVLLPRTMGRPAARQWLRSHGYKTRMDTPSGGAYFHARQRSPAGYKRTRLMPPTRTGIRLAIGVPK